MRAMRGRRLPSPTELGEMGPGEIEEANRLAGEFLEACANANVSERHRIDDLILRGHDPYLDPHS